MSDISREELDAKLETIEVRMDGRVASIHTKIDTFIIQLKGQNSLAEARMGQLERSASETSDGIRNLKNTVILTAVSTVVAIVFGVAAFNATVLSNMVASFESGKNSATSQAEIKRLTERGQSQSETVRTPATR